MSDRATAAWGFGILASTQIVWAAQGAKAGAILSPLLFAASLVGYAVAAWSFAGPPDRARRVAFAVALGVAAVAFFARYVPNLVRYPTAPFTLAAGFLGVGLLLAAGQATWDAIRPGAPRRLLFVGLASALVAFVGIAAVTLQSDPAPAISLATLAMQAAAVVLVLAGLGARETAGPARGADAASP